jgi:hypothetical protein
VLYAGADLSVRSNRAIRIGRKTGVSTQNAERRNTPEFYVLRFAFFVQAAFLSSLLAVEPRDEHGLAKDVAIHGGDDGVSRVGGLLRRS